MVLTDLTDLVDQFDFIMSFGRMSSLWCYFNGDPFFALGVSALNFDGPPGDGLISEKSAASWTTYLLGRNHSFLVQAQGEIALPLIGSNYFHRPSQNTDTAFLATTILVKRLPTVWTFLRFGHWRPQFTLGEVIRSQDRALSAQGCL